MQLPENLQHFPKATLILASDSVHAKFFLVGGDSLQELDGVGVPREAPQDNEGPFTFDINDGPRLHDFVHQLVTKTVELTNAHGVAHIHLVMPAEVEHMLSSHLPQPVQALIGQTLHHDLMKSSPLELVERLLKD